MTKSDVFYLLSSELEEARANYPRFNTLHEAYAVLLEEVDELWDEIKKKPASRNDGRIAKEAVQVAAMAARLLVDLVP